MTDPIELRLGDRTVYVVRSQDVESWSRERTAGVLGEAAREWPARRSLLRLSDELLGPDDDIDRALAFLADAVERGLLLAVRLPDEAAGLADADAGADAWDDVPRLSDLEDPSDAGDDDRTRRDPVEPPRAPTTDPSLPGARDPSDTTDPAATFVAFAVFDQHGRPLRGRSECRIDTKTNAHALDGSTIEIRPVPPHAEIQLQLRELAPAS
jgi:hypothetical protein